MRPTSGTYVGAEPWSSAHRPRPARQPRAGCRRAGGRRARAGGWGRAAASPSSAAPRAGGRPRRRRTGRPPRRSPAPTAGSRGARSSRGSPPGRGAGAGSSRRRRPPGRGTSAQIGRPRCPRRSVSRPPCDLPPIRSSPPRRLLVRRSRSACVRRTDGSAPTAPDQTHVRSRDVSGGFRRTRAVDMNSSSNRTGGRRQSDEVAGGPVMGAVQQAVLDFDEEILAPWRPRLVVVAGQGGPGAPAPLRARPSGRSSSRVGICRPPEASRGAEVVMAPARAPREVPVARPASGERRAGDGPPTGGPAGTRDAPPADAPGTAARQRPAAGARGRHRLLGRAAAGRCGRRPPAGRRAERRGPAG